MWAGASGSVRLALDNLKRLEYRGYDSAGVAVVEPGAEERHGSQKAGQARQPGGRAGRAGAVQRDASSRTRAGRRTGGPTMSTPTRTCDCSGRIALIHNGIIENYIGAEGKADGGRARLRRATPTPKCWRT